VFLLEFFYISLRLVSNALLSLVNIYILLSNSNTWVYKCIFFSLSFEYLSISSDFSLNVFLNSSSNLFFSSLSTINSFSFSAFFISFFCSFYILSIKCSLSNCILDISFDKSDFMELWSLILSLSILKLSFSYSNSEISFSFIST
jgi:hypothetical protein